MRVLKFFYLFKLNRTRRLAGAVVHDAVDALDFVYDPVCYACSARPTGSEPQSAVMKSEVSTARRAMA